MHIELIDLLRCPRDHEETWLVAALNAVLDRFVLKAKLGCPVCGASYSISKGVADLRIKPTQQTQSWTESDSKDPQQTAAYLNLTRAGSLAILEGPYASASQQVSEMTQCKVIALNPALQVEDSETVATVLCDERIPFASASVAGIALAKFGLMDDTPRVLRQGGRVILPVTPSIPAGLTEIARDDQQVIAEAVGTIITLTR